MACMGTIAALGMSLVLAANEPVRIGTETPYPPFLFVDASGEISGFERDLGDAVCARAQLDCSWETVPFDQLIPSVMTGRFDIVISAIAVTPERLKLVDFSLPYDVSNDFHTIYGFANAPEPQAARVGVQSGTIQESHARDQGWNVQEFGTAPEVLSALVAGQIDLAFSAWASEFDNRNDIMGLYEEEIPDLGTAMAVCKGNDALLSKINAALEAMQADGTIDEINDRWL